MDFKNDFKVWTEMVNTALEGYVAEKDTPEGIIYKAMKYSLTAGGKRLRPVLALAVAKMLGGKEEDVLPYACAIEMIHTYSLIHDDLPAMDNDDYRRGRLTNHKVFGEAMAILAGDGLLNLAFETMLNYSSENTSNSLARIRAMGIIAESAGTKGMIGGQVVDLEAEGENISADTLEYMHRCKTGALIKAPVLSAAVLCGAEDRELALLEEYAVNLGLAFQIKDDIMDVESSFEKMGKPAGSDAANDKSTFVTLYGLEKSKKMLHDITLKASAALDSFGEKAAFLKKLADYMENREN